MTPPAVTETLNLTLTLTRPVPLPELQQHWQAPPPLETVLGPGRDDDHTPGTLEIADAADEFLNTLNLADTALLRLAAVAPTMAPYPTRPPPTPTESSNLRPEREYIKRKAEGEKRRLKPRTSYGNEQPKYPQSNPEGEKRRLKPRTSYGNERPKYPYDDFEGGKRSNFSSTYSCKEPKYPGD
jgi:hypothetical protein